MLTTGTSETSVRTCKVVEFCNSEEQNLKFQCIEEDNRVGFGLGQV